MKDFKQARLIAKEKMVKQNREKAMDYKSEITSKGPKQPRSIPHHPSHK